MNYEQLKHRYDKFSDFIYKNHGEEILKKLELEVLIDETDEVLKTKTMRDFDRMRKKYENSTKIIL